MWKSPNPWHGQWAMGIGCRVLLHFYCAEFFLTYKCNVKNYSMVFKMLCEFHFAMFSIFRSTCLWLHCSAKDIRNGGNYPQKVASFVQCGWCWVCKSPLNKATFVIMQTDDAMCAQCTHNLHSFMMSSCTAVWYDCLREMKSLSLAAFNTLCILGSSLNYLQNNFLSIVNKLDNPEHKLSLLLRS